MVTRWPAPRRTRCGTRARVTRNGAVRLTAIVRAKSSGVVSATGLMKKMPALFTTMSGTPRSRTRPTARSTAAGSVTSQRRSVRRPVVPSTRLRASRTTCDPAAYSSPATAVYQPQEFVPGLRILQQRAPQGARDRLGVLLLDAAHHHAEMVRLDHDTHTARLEYVHERVRHLVGESLLHLEPAGKHLDHAWDLGETDQAAVRQVGDVRPTEERQQVVLAQRVDLDVAHAHQVLVPLAVQGVTDHVRDRHVVPAGEPLEGRLDAGRRLTQALAARVLAELIEDLAHQTLERRARAGRRDGRQRLGMLVVEAVQAGGLHLVASHAC